jgi:hypothetical protein
MTPCFFLKFGKRITYLLKSSQQEGPMDTAFVVALSMLSSSSRQLQVYVTLSNFYPDDFCTDKEYYLFMTLNCGRLWKH